MPDQEPPTTLPDIYSIGQRRAPGGTFPSGAAGGGNHNNPGGPHYNEVGPDEPEPVFDPAPCLDAVTALEWNADAAAAEAMRRFRLKAAELGDDDLYQREFHAFLYRDSAGRVYVGGVTAGNRVGSSEQSTVGNDWTGVTPDNIVGEVHSHPGGSVAPSGDDWTRFDGIRGWIDQFSSTQRSGEYRHYIVAREITDPNSQFAPRVYDDTSPRNEDGGPEVNPDAQPCP